MKDLKVGNTIGDKTILWMDEPSELIPDMLIKVGEFDSMVDFSEKCFNCGTNHTKTTKKFINIKFIRLSEL